MGVQFMISTYYEIYKNWFVKNRVQSTGVTIGTVILLLQPPVEASIIGTAGAIYVPPFQNRQSNDYFSPQLKVPLDYHAAAQRTIAEDLARIRAVLKPTISNLATIFGVSRQAIYNWLSGEIPVSLHADKIRDFASVVDIVASEGIVVTGQILKRKLKDGKSLFEIVRDGGSAKEGAQMLVRLLRRESEQRKIMESRLANRTKHPVNPLDIGSPMLDERV